MAFGILEKVRYAVLAQQVEHFHGKEEVGSSNLLNGFEILFIVIGCQTNPFHKRF